jgi:hypothetical protein
MPVDSHITQLLDKTPKVASSTSGSTATLPSATMSHAQLQELMDKARSVGHEVVLTAGVLTVKPRP